MPIWILRMVLAGWGLADDAQALRDAPQAPAVPAFGSQVVTRYAQPLRFGGRVVDRGATARVYRVGYALGNYVWISSGNVAGWVDAESIIPYAEVIDFYTRAIESRPTSSAYNWRGSWWDKMGNSVQAIADFDAAIRLDPADAWAHQNKGYVLSHRGQYLPALQEFDEAIRLDPNNSAARVDRGVVFKQLARYDQAIADFDEAIRLDPHNAGPFQGRGNVAYARKNYRQAIADYDAAIRLNPTYVPAYLSRGSSHLILGQTDQAIADSDAALRIDPANVAAYTNRATARMKQRDYDQAISDLTAALQLDATQASVFDTRGQIWHYKSEAARAIADYDRALALDSTQTSVYLNRGDAQWCRRNYDQTRADYDTALRLDPRSARACKQRAWLCATCANPTYRDGTKAVESALKACELTGWTDPEAIDALAAAHAEGGNFDQALTHGRRAIELTANDPDALKSRHDRLARYERQQPDRTAECAHP